MRRIGALSVLLVAIATQACFVSVASAAEEQLTYSVKEARAYAVKGSLSKEVIEAAPKCKPEEDKKYSCTDHNHKPNCPKGIEIGEKGKVPMPAPPKGVEPQSGRAGEGIGEGPPPQSSPVRLNRLLSLSKISHLFDVKEAGGLASSMYTDNSGRSEPEAHTVSEGYSSSVRDWEERCFWRGGSEDKNSYEHFLSRSGKGPDTYHLAECVGRQCQFGVGINAERAQQIVYMKETKGKVFGAIGSVVEGLTFGGGSFTVESITTYVRFETDGTEPGLKWEVVSRASEAKLGGNPIPIPPGDTVRGPGFSVGMSEPFVEAAPDGTSLTVVAPGLHVGSEQQAALFGGAEVYMSASKQTELDFEADGEELVDDGGAGSTFDGGDFGSGSTDFGGGTSDFEGGVTDPSGGEATLATEETGALLIFEKATGVGAVAVIVALGGFCWFLLLSRWLQRYAWGTKLTRFQPFKFFDWMYRAFVKS